MTRTTIRKKKWIAKYQKNYGKKSVPFDFERFMKKNKITVEDLIMYTNYSKVGVIGMLSRGTIKPSLIKTLNTYYSNIHNFVRKVK